MRIGQGFDVHPLVEGRKLILGGVEIAYPRGLDGHSDADVLAHALGDALLGAAGLGDLGRHFPNTDPRWKDASSLDLLARIRELVHAAGFAVVNADLTLLAEAPKIAPFVEHMRHNLAEVVGLDPNLLSIKATTTERLGFVGRGEGLAALAVALLEEIQR